MLNHFLSQVRDQISKNIEFVIGNSNHIEEAMNYSALSESKMIRAALIFASADTHNFLKNGPSWIYLGWYTSVAFSRLL